jgi:adenine deaminase
MALREQIEAARGLRPPDLVLKRARIVDVFTNEILATDVAVHDGTIVGLGSYRGPNELDLAGALVTPGLIDGHIHLESTLLSPARL